MLHNIIWDVDGTLFDTYPAIAGAMHTALRELGGNAPLALVADLAKISLRHCLSALADRCRVPVEELAERFTAHYDPLGPAAQPPFPGVEEVCAYILSLGGKNVIVTHRGRAGTEALLAHHGLAAMFAGIVARDDGYARKPDPAAFLSAMARHGLRPEETLTVGDREIDMLAGKAAGICTCLFGPDAPETVAEFSVGSLKELQRFLQERNSKT